VSGCGAPSPCQTAGVLRVGLTGGVGSGKSEVSRRLRQRGAVVIDADALAREVVAPGTDGLAEVVGAFGRRVLGPEGRLDRAAVAKWVFGDPAARRRLEAIIHPRVRARAAQIESATDADAMVVHDIPLLVETGQVGDFDVVVVVDTPEEVQVARLVESGRMTSQEARARIAAQSSREHRLAAAGLVIDNSGSLAELDVRVDVLWQALATRRT